MTKLPKYNNLTVNVYQSAIVEYMKFFSKHSDFFNIVIHAKQQDLLGDNSAVSATTSAQTQFTFKYPISDH